MANNARGAFNSALSLFCSLYQDMNPTDLPEGLSPDNQDVWFFPGSVQTRPALQRLITSIGTQQIMSMKEFPLPNGDYLNVFLDSQGNLRTRDVLSGGLAIIGTVIPGVQFKAENAFQKQWYAFYSASLAAPFSNNPFVGVDVPRYYDGANVWRVTQDAPGAAPQVADESISLTIVAAPNGLAPYAPANISGISQVGNLVTVQTTLGGTGFIRIGDTFQIAGFTSTAAGYNGTWVCSGFEAITGNVQYVNSQTGLPVVGSGVGTIQPALMVVTTSSPNTLIAAGRSVTVSGAGVAGYNVTGTLLQIAGAINYVYNVGVFGLATSGGGTMGSAGKISAGIHNGVLMFKSGNGALTAPSIPFQWTAAGGKRAIVSQLAIGPPGTTQRVLAFTQSAGSLYSYVTPAIVPSSAGLPTTTVTGTIVFDNTSGTVTLDFSDTELAAGTFIDQPGNNLFNQVVLAPCLGVAEYVGSGRLCWWGEINNIKNFVNAGMDGGFVGVSGPPLGWAGTYSTNGVNTISANGNQGFVYAWSGGSGARDGAISQGAYQDYYGAPILEPNKKYIFRLLAGYAGNPSGSLVCDFFSPSQGVLATATIAVNSLANTPIPPNAVLRWTNATFSANTPASIPSDAVIRIYLQNAAPGVVVYGRELEIIDAAQPVLAQQARVSYFNNPFGYDDITGLIGIDGSASINGAFTQRGYLYLNTDEGVHQTQNNGQTEPNDWTVSEFARACGNAGPNAVDAAEGVAFWVGKHGLRVFYGDTPKKISQENQPIFDSINWAAALAVWLANDPQQRIIYCGLPINGASAPSIVYPTSYRSVNVAYEVPDPLHISFSGRMICSDLSRKSTRWNVFANCGAMMTTAMNLTRQMLFGSGNGQAPGSGSAYGNLYTLNSLKYTDDDYGTIASYYTTYAHWNHDMEQNVPQLGLHRKSYKYLSAFITGVGNVQITPYVDSLNNPYPAKPLVQLSQNLAHDLEWPVNVDGDRVFFKVAVLPLPGTTDAAFNLQHMVVAGEMDKVFPVRGAIL